MGCGGSKSEQATSPKPKAKSAEKSSPVKTDNAAPAASSDPAEMSAPAASSAPAGSFSAGKNIKLISFKGPGLGDLARRMLVLKNVEFEDVRIEKEDWPEHKPNTPYGVLPVLEVDGKKIGQSLAIARMLAKDFGLTGKNDQEAALADEFCDYAGDFRPCFYPLYVAKEEDRTEELVNECKEKAKPLVDRVEDMLTKSSSGYIIGDQLTWADLSLYTLTGLFAMFYGKDYLSAFPKTLAHAETIGAMPETKAYDEKYMASSA